MYFLKEQVYWKKYNFQKEKNAVVEFLKIC